MVVTPERAARVCFSDPTFAVRPGLLVPKGNPLRLCPRLCSASNVLVRVAVLSGSIEERAFNEQTPSRCQRVVVPDARTGRVAVETGAADAFALSAPSVRWMAKTDRSGATECVVSTNTDTDAQVTTGYGAFAFRKDDARLVKAWNRQQRAFVGSAEHAALLSRFGFLRDEVDNLGKKGSP
jgi:polar amino acid transport system substrate-binding protein